MTFAEPTTPRLYTRRNIRVLRESVAGIMGNGTNLPRTRALAGEAMDYVHRAEQATTEDTARRWVECAQVHADTAAAHARLDADCRRALGPLRRIEARRAAKLADAPRYDYPEGTRIGVSLHGPQSSGLCAGIVLASTEDTCTVRLIRWDGNRTVTLTRDGWEDGGSFPLDPEQG